MTLDIRPDDALIVVDVQKDFCPGGALAITGGDAVVPVLADLIPRFAHVVFTRDWHPKNHCSFAPEPRFVDGSWPTHCVRDTPGAAFHADLPVPADALIVSKAETPEREAYSGFDGTELGEQLRALGVRRAFIGGLATDYCVKATALDAVDAGFEAIVLLDACRAVDPATTGPAAESAMRDAGVTLAESKDLAHA